MTELDALAADGFGHWLAGFIDGEGCFVIHGTAGGRLKCRLAVAVRADELPTLETIQARTGAGTIVTRPQRGTTKPEATWQVQSRPDCLRMAEIFDRFPLRAKKARDYAIWRSALRTWATVRRTGYPGVNDEVWRRMEASRKALNEGRRFV